MIESPVTILLPTVISVGETPLGVAFNPAGTRAYVTNYSDNTVSVINTETSTQIAVIPLNLPGGPPGARGVAVNSAGTRVYVTNSGADLLHVIDTATNTVTALVSVGDSPVAVALSR